MNTVVFVTEGAKTGHRAQSAAAAPTAAAHPAPRAGAAPWRTPAACAAVAATQAALRAGPARHTAKAAADWFFSTLQPIRIVTAKVVLSRFHSNVGLACSAKAFQCLSRYKIRKLGKGDQINVMNGGKDVISYSTAI